MGHDLRGFLRVSAAAILPLILLPAPGRGQVARFSARTELVLLSATAVDRKGRPVTDLRREEFRVYEDGRPQKVDHFSLGRDSRARLLVLVDASGSMTGQLKTASARMAVTQILAALEPQDEAALAGFDHRYFGLVPFTTDRQKILSAFDEVETFGSTGLHDGLDRAARDLASHGEARRAVVVITDGVDTASQNRPEDVIARSRALDVPIYAVTVVSPIDDPNSPRFAGMQRPAAANIAYELKHQYRLGYDPPAGPPRFRRVEVRTTRKGVMVRTRSGYVPRS